MTRRMFTVVMVVAFALCFSTVAQANDPHTGGSTGRPGQTCQDLGNPPPTPGNSANAAGSPFDATGIAGTKYAGAQPQNSQNGQASQYDVACFQQSVH